MNITSIDEIEQLIMLVKEHKLDRLNVANISIQNSRHNDFVPEEKKELSIEEQRLIAEDLLFHSAEQ